MPTFDFQVVFAAVDAMTDQIADVNKAGFGVARVESADEPVFMKINLELARS